LADQLLLPMALAGRGMFRTLSPTRHTRTNIEVIAQFLDVPIRCEEEENKTWRITVG
jgi:RNA 3'-terminal phosphate cyclase (ATP)